MGRLTFLLDPLVHAIGDHVRAGSALHADDTPVPVLDPGRGRTKTGRLWTLVRDERPWAGPEPPAAVYLYSPDRRGVRADAYAGFGRLYAPTTPQGDARLAEVARGAHARRKIYDIHHSTRSPAAAEALERIAELFAIEAEIRGATPATRLEARRRHTVPRLAALKDHLEATLARISRKSKLAEAIRYATSRWEALSRFTEDGRLEMTNNAAERAIRPLALGRNYARHVIMRSSPKGAPAGLTRRRIPARRTAHNSKALKELHQLVRGSIPAGARSDRLQPVESALFH